MYIHDSGEMLATAPFEAHDIQFSVFEQMPKRTTSATTAALVTASNPFENTNGSYSDSSSLASFLESDEMQPVPALSPAVWPLGWDIELKNMLEDKVSPAEPRVLPPAELAPTVDYNYTTSTSLQGIFKTNFYRQSHWTNFAYKVSQRLGKASSSAFGVPFLCHIVFRGDGRHANS